MTIPHIILVATDFSEPSGHALDSAIEFARKFEAELHLTHVHTVPVALVAPYEVTLPNPYLEETRKVAARKLAAAAAKVAEAGLAVKTHLTEGPAAGSIAETAEAIGADLLVMGTRGHTGLKHVVLGSVAAHVLRLAPCSVLTVKTADAG